MSNKSVPAFFVSHATPDEALALELVAMLEARGEACFLAHRTGDIEAGSDWERTLQRNLTGCRKVVALVSKHWEGAHYQKGEVQATMAKVVPVWVGITAAKAPLSLRPLQGLDLKKLGMAGVVDALLGGGATGVVSAALNPRVAAWQAEQLERHRAIRILGAGPRDNHQLPIEKIYVPLYIEAVGRPHLSREPSRRRRRSPDPLEDLLGGAAPASNPTIEGAFAELERRRGLTGGLRAGISVVGDPGAGKTTLLRHLFCRCVWEGSASLGLPPGLVPVYMRLADHWSKVVDTSGDRPRARLEVSLEALVRQAVNSERAEAGDALLASGNRRLLLLLDGMDEVRDEPTRLALSGWLLEQLPGWHDQARVVLTSRRSAWKREGDKLQRELEPFHVAGFSEDEIRTYVGSWYGLMVPLEQPAGMGKARVRTLTEGFIDALLPQLISDDIQGTWRLNTLARNPLLLCVICLIHLRRRAQLPRSRWKLYEECLHLLLEVYPRENERRSMSSSDAISVLRPLGWHMQEARTAGDSDRDATVVDEDSLLGVLDKGLRRKGKHLGLTAPQMLGWLHHNGLLEAVDFERWRFAHLTFQEYLAAVEAKEKGRGAELAGFLGVPWWTETISLAVAMGGQTWGDFVAEALRIDLNVAQADQVLACFRELLEEEDPELEPVVAACVAGAEALAGGSAEGPPAGALVLGLRLAHALREDEHLELTAEELRAEVLRRHNNERVRAAAKVMLAEEVVEVPGPRRSESWTEGLPGRVKREADIVILRRSLEVAGQELELVWVPPGRFLMGATKTRGALGFDEEARDSEGPPTEVDLAQGFWLGRFPVTNALFRAFQRDQGRPEPTAWREARFSAPGHPVVTVSQGDGFRLCQWLQERLPAGLEATLPTELQWEWAARGPGARRFPWGGEDPDDQRACFGRNYQTEGHEEVGGRPAGAGPFGAEDQAGLVWEWTRSEWRDDLGAPHVDGGCQLDDKVGLAPRVIRGGSWGDPSGYLRCAFRDGVRPGGRGPYLGLRLSFQSPARA